MKIILDSIGELRHTEIGDLPVADVKVVRHRSGKIYIRYLIDNLIDALAEDMRQNIADNYDNFVVIDGPEGSGKSNIAYELCKAYCPDFEIGDNYLYSMNDLMARISTNTDMGNTFWMDEITNIANKRQWATQENKLFVELLEMCRSRRWSIISCIPRFDRLDQYIREHRARYWIHCEPMTFNKYGYKERGYFQLKKRDKFGVFHMIGYGTYRAMPSEISKEYESIKLNSQNTKIREAVEGPEKPGAKYKTLYEGSRRDIQDAIYNLKKSGKLTEIEIAEAFGMNKKAFRNAYDKARERRKDED